MSIILDGKKTAQKVAIEVKEEIEKLLDKKKLENEPCLTAILVGKDAASEIYVSSKAKKCKEVGITSKVLKLEEETKESELLELVESLNKDNETSGILVQFPVPEHVEEKNIRNSIFYKKDVDGLSRHNIAEVTRGNEILAPCTPKGIIRILEEYGIEVEGKHAVVVGRSELVGKPMASMLLNRNATVTQCHSRTIDLRYFTKQADILIAAVGKPKLIKAEMVKENAVVIDVGINRIDTEQTIKEDIEGTRLKRQILIGDTDFEALKEKVYALTPVPGGIGPMTVAMLLRNTLNAAKLQSGLH